MTVVIDTATLVTREAPNAAKVARFQEMLRDGRTPPPIAVMPCAKAWNGRERWLLLDGHHRLLAARREGFLQIAAEVVNS
jgi:hypothetical protein